jgi:serine/threonine-protein kinase PpkA
MNAILKSALAAVALSGMLSMQAWAEQPLVQPGKHSVYQRVVSHPNAQVYERANAKSAVVYTPRTFTSFYVYDRQDDMLRVGVSAERADGWLRVSESTEWPQAVTMVFTDQMGRDPVLFFKNHTEVQKACEAPSIRDYVSKLSAQVSSGQPLPEEFPVLAAAPQGRAGQVARDSFYLLPVLNIDSQFKESGAQLLEVACLDPGNPQGDTQQQQPAAGGGMSTALAFVIDTTISMGPYIEQAKRMIGEIFDEMQRSPAKDQFAIAVVGFRSNVDARPDTEYTTKIISDFKSIQNREELVALLDGLKEAQASTHAFDEDSFAGVKDAVDQLSWGNYSSRAMLLLTDAGPLVAGDPLSKTGMSAEGLADYLRTNQIYLTAVHLKTPAGFNDHPFAENNYRALAKMSNGRTGYIDIHATDPAEGTRQFEIVGRTMASTYRQMLESTAAGEMLQKPEMAPEPKKETPEQKAKRLAAITGYAMQLQFLGDKQQTAAPSVKRAWIADTDLAALEAQPNEAPVPAVYPAVLLTKTQLSQLRRQLKSIITTAEEAFLQDNANFNFYEQLVSAAAQMSRDPTKFSTDPNANLAKKGVLLEVLDGLPYKSRILGMQKDDWVNMSTGEQQEFIKRLKGLIARYDEYDRDSAHWEGFGSNNPNEWVYRVPLSMLP